MVGTTDDAIVVDDLRRSFGEIEALRGASLRVPAGTVVGLLGPNGAGKTTMVRILTTLLLPSAGHATVLGLDVVRDAAELRGRIALAGQFAAVDELLSGRENLVMVGRLFRLPAPLAQRRALELLERFELADAGERLVRTYSGGMRRRLDLAASLVGQPEVLFLDEPTTGLDPRSRRELWTVIHQLVHDGTTLLLTTQYLEEADQLANTIAVIDGGLVIAQGRSAELKSHVGGDVLELHVADLAQVGLAAEQLRPLASGEVSVNAERGLVTAPVAQGGEQLAEAVRRLDAAGVTIEDLALRRPSLDDVFLALTGHGAEEVAPASADTGRRRRRDAGEPAA